MINMNRFKVLLYAVFPAMFLLLLSGCVEQKVASKSCNDCHFEEVAKFKSEGTLHAPIKEGKCEECHLPHGLLGGMRLKSANSKLCYSCHDEKDHQKKPTPGYW